jgi:pimeloyl-ACP methyl ester carboxylesterase
LTVRLRLVVAVVGVVSILAGCAPSPPAPPPSYNRPQRSLTPPFPGATELPPADMTDDGPGSLVNVNPLKGSVTFQTANATAVQVLYRSTSSSGQPTLVSGVVAVPAGKPPKGGWPVISFGHSLTGVDMKCAPSLAKELGGYASAMVTLLNRGYVVAMSDYQGLGVKGYDHVALDWVTLGNNMIDVVRAARRVLPDIGDKWAAEGSGQGGLAAWAAAERARDYGAGLNMVGAVALSPFSDMSPLVDVASKGALSSMQERLLMVLLQNISAHTPDFDLDAYRSGVAKDQWDVLTDCAPADPAGAQKAAAQVKGDDLRPRDDAAAGALRDLLSATALPGNGGPPPAPVLVVYATDDTMVPQAGVARTLKSACAKGDPVVVMRLIGETSTTNYQIVQTTLSWLKSRFDGERPGNICVGAS